MFLVVMMTALALAPQQKETSTSTETPANPAKLISGTISKSDYPIAAKRIREEGRTVVGFDVDTSGKPLACQVVETSGSDTLDSTTCELILSRFRYEPASDASGTPVVEHKLQGVTWKLDGVGPDLSDGPISISNSYILHFDASGKLVRCESETDFGCPTHLPDRPVSIVTFDGKPTAYSVHFTSSAFIAPE